jgi:hypothetical protein
MQDFGEAFTPRRADKARQSHDLTSAARGVLGHAGIERVLRSSTRTRSLPGRP